MTNQLTQAVSQHKYNSIVLNGIILGIITAILTALFLPVGNGAFFGLTFLCMFVSSSLYLSLFQKFNPNSKIQKGEIVIMLALFFITSIFMYLSGMEILHWNIPYHEYRVKLHQDTGYVWTMSEYEDRLAGLPWLALLCSEIGIQILSLVLASAIFGKKWLFSKNYFDAEKIDFFLLNSACAWFLWKRKIV